MCRNFRYKTSVLSGSFVFWHFNASGIRLITKARTFFRLCSNVSERSMVGLLKAHYSYNQFSKYSGACVAISLPSSNSHYSFTTSRPNGDSCICLSLKLLVIRQILHITLFGKAETCACIIMRTQCLVCIHHGGISLVGSCQSS